MGLDEQLQVARTLPSAHFYLELQRQPHLQLTMSGPGDYHPHHPHSYAPGLAPPDLHQRYGDPNLSLPLNPPDLSGAGASTRGKRKANNDEDEDDEKPATGAGAKEGKGGASEFVKKLYR